jgi:proteasome alpha subunit
MSMPFYVSPEQLMKDRADFARKGIGRGRALAVLQYADGIVLVSENPRSLHKISEIYDRVAFAAVGRYNEFENLRIAGVRLADMRGYAYDRRDVTARGLANAYAQTLGTIFSSGGEKPYEVEIFVAQIGETAADDEVYRITFDGQMVDEHGFAVMGGYADTITGYLSERYRDDLSLDEAVTLAVDALGHGEPDARTVTASDLEVAVLDRSRSQQRKFKRLSEERLAGILGDRGDGGGEAAEPVPPPGPSAPQQPAPPAEGEQPPVAPPVAPPLAPPHEPSDPAAPMPSPEPGTTPHPPVDPDDPLR